MSNERGQIIKQAASYFRNDGLRTVSMQELADALNVSRSSLYYHFGDKGDLVYATLMATATEFCDRVREILQFPISASQRLNIILRTTLKLQVNSPGARLALIVRDGGSSFRPEQREDVVAKRDEYEGYFRQLLDEGAASGEFRVVNTKIVIIAILGMLEEFNAWFDAEGDLSSDEVADIFSDLILSALSPQGQPVAQDVSVRRRRRSSPNPGKGGA
jgi:AcrR family transcriptional regulator